MDMAHVRAALESRDLRSSGTVRELSPAMFLALLAARLVRAN
jgi:hypothetical protein